MMHHHTQYHFLEVYRKYINNYGIATETIKTLYQSKPLFQRYLDNQQVGRESLASLLVTPVCAALT
jgi:hypothetical protein